MNSEQKQWFKDIIQPKLVEMATDDKLPMDMNELYWEMFDKNAVLLETKEMYALYYSGYKGKHFNATGTKEELKRNFLFDVDDLAKDLDVYESVCFPEPLELQEGTKIFSVRRLDDELVDAPEEHYYEVDGFYEVEGLDGLIDSIDKIPKDYVERAIARSSTWLWDNEPGLMDTLDSIENPDRIPHGPEGDEPYTLPLGEFVFIESCEGWPFMVKKISKEDYDKLVYPHSSKYYDIEELDKETMVACLDKMITMFKERRSDVVDNIYEILRGSTPDELSIPEPQMVKATIHTETGWIDLCYDTYHTLIEYRIDDGEWDQADCTYEDR
jgi:hypothetical protein